MEHHHHKCECEHKRIRFCRKCKRPYCLDCGTEWYETQWYYNYPYTYWSTTYTTKPLESEPVVTWSSSNTEVCKHN